MSEIWKDVPGYEGIYQVSNTGKCMRIANGSDGRRIRKREVFPKMAGVNHKDGDKHNNNLSNLEWATPKENQQHRYNSLGQSQNGEKNPSNKYPKELIRKVLSMYESGKYTQREISRETEIDYRYVNSIVHRKVWKHIRVTP